MCLAEAARIRSDPALTYKESLFLVVVHCGPGRKLHRCKVGQGAMRPVVVVIDRPDLDDRACGRQRAKQRFVQALVAEPAIERLRRSASGYRVMCCHSTQRSCCHLSIAFEVSSVELSPTIITRGRPRTSTIRSSSRATRAPDVDVSTTNARHSWEKSSTTAKTLKVPAC